MAFTASFIYNAIDGVSPVIEKINKRTKASTRLAIRSFKAQTKASEKYRKSLKSIGATTGKMSIGIVAGLAVITREGAKYESALASLSAITGLTGNNLGKMSGEIKNISKEFGLGASDIAKGMELIGSKQPELLKTPAILLSVARATATLSKASGEDFATSGENLADVMNQFSIKGKNADRVINVLASSAKFGASQIPELTRALIESGTSANSAKLSIEQTSAVIEILAEKGIKGARAGSQLRNVLTKLESSGVKKLTPSLVGLDMALENLAKQELTTKEMTKQFGLENLNAIRVIIDSRTQIKKFASDIKDTSVAQQQASIRMNTFTEQAKRLRAEIGVELINAFEELKPSLISILKTIKTIIPVVVEFIKDNKFLIKAFIVLTPLIWLSSKALLFFNTALILSSTSIKFMKATKLGAWMIQMASKTRIGAFAMKLFGSATAKALIALTIIIFTITKLIQVWNAWKALKTAEDLEKESGAYAKSNEQILKRFQLLTKLNKAQGGQKIRIKDLASRTKSILKERGESADNTVAFASARLTAINERIAKIEKNKPDLSLGRKEQNSKLDVNVKIKTDQGTSVQETSVKSSNPNLIGKSEVD